MLIKKRKFTPNSSFHGNVASLSLFVFQNPEILDGVVNGEKKPSAAFLQTRSDCPFKFQFSLKDHFNLKCLLLKNDWHLKVPQTVWSLWRDLWWAVMVSCSLEARLRVPAEPVVSKAKSLYYDLFHYDVNVWWNYRENRLTGFLCV